MLAPALAALAGITVGTCIRSASARARPAHRVGRTFRAQPAADRVRREPQRDDADRLDEDFVFALLWLVLVLSLGAISLLNLLIRSGSAVNVASLFYLTPPTTALMAWLLFGETLTGLALVGMIVAVAGVWLARKT